jgi:hypothetical protein
MVESGSALAVMGNHEFNAIAYATESGSGDYLRLRNPDNQNQHAAFLGEYPLDSAAYLDAIEWFKGLPLWLDLGEIRVVHACWDQNLMDCISRDFDGTRLTDDLLHRANPVKRMREKHWEFGALETLLKGKEIPLPQGHHFTDSDGKKRHHIRIRWWSPTETTYRGIYLGSSDWETQIPDDEIQGDHAIDYDHSAPPVFLGHYWLSGMPAPLESNVACLDYSVAQKPERDTEGAPTGKLVAYRWNGDQNLIREAFVWVDRVAQ